MKTLLNAIRGFLFRATKNDEKITVQSVVRQSQIENRSRDNSVKVEVKTEAETDAECFDPTVPTLKILGEEDLKDRTQGFDPYDSLSQGLEPDD